MISGLLFLSLLQTCLIHAQENRNCEKALFGKTNSHRSNKWHERSGSSTLLADIAILPVGSIENHGPHLPVGTDLILAETFVNEATIDLENTIVLPASPFGASFEHANKQGTLPIDDTILNGLWDNLLSALSRQGYQKVLIVNAHGGQTANVEIAAREARFQHNILVVSFNIQAAMAEAWRDVKKEDDFRNDDDELDYGIHGGLIETSVMLHINPNLVDVDKLSHFRPRWNRNMRMLKPHSAIVSYGWRSEDLCAEGALGDASKASIEKGKKIFDKTCGMLRVLIAEVLDAGEGILDVQDVSKR